ncbi:root meristem growth factor 3-like [Durio zibethinus]|uniref:Root meristem growth factor 3-like n=1 Tax=Durio zibethinus TaxID=66656 RepID=A0A6P5XHM8_DURZI|nr:root meristem growth factor 3-like [Durio zibethinus]
MAAGRETCLLILLLIAAWISFAQASQGISGIPDSNHKISTGKVIVKGLLLDGERAVTAATSKNWLGGRKMVVVRQMKKPKDVKMSGAQTVSHFSNGVDESGFVAFNADYHAPRHHPPKNN